MMIVRTFRIDEEVYERARDRAEREGIPVTRAVSELVEGYANEKYKLPVIEVIRRYSRERT